MKKRIFISSFEIKDIGGISTSVYNFIKTFAPYYDIDLCVLTNHIAPRYIFPDNVTIVPFKPLFEEVYGARERIYRKTILGKVRCLSWRIFRKIYGYERTLPIVMKDSKIDKKYDIAIAFWNDLYDSNGFMRQGGDYYEILNNVQATLKIAWVHNDANQLGFTNLICKRMFKDFDAIVNVSYDCKSVFDQIIPEYKEKSFVVYNCYDINEIKAKANFDNPFEDNGKIHFVTVCRMNEQQKRISRIVEVCNRLKQQRYNTFDWTIVGDGDDRLTYEKISKKNGTTDILHFVGLKVNPYPYMKYADAFILSSLYEGLPMTIRETQITGTPTFSTQFGAAEEAIIKGAQGDICENTVDGLYTMIKDILNNPRVLKTYRDYLSNNPITNDISLKQFEDIISNGFNFN